jgi:hypothetical protein
MPFPTMGDYQTKQTLETFGFLPPMSQDEIYDQIAYIIAQGWTPAIEHSIRASPWTTTGPCGSCRSSASRTGRRRRRARGLPSQLSGSSRPLTGYDNYTKARAVLRGLPRPRLISRHGTGEAACPLCRSACSGRWQLTSGGLGTAQGAVGIRQACRQQHRSDVDRWSEGTQSRGYR